MCVPVGDLFFEVGPEVELAADRFRARQLHDGYTETPEYRAFMAGALHYMREDVIDLLVLGLPVAQYMARRAALEKAMTGTFHLGRRRQVEVRRVLVVAQPQGALFSYAASTGRLAEVLGQKNLVIDVGSRTFDWLVTRGVKVVARMSHSVNRGVSDILRTVALAIGAEIGEEYRDFEAIDQALCTGKPLRVYQKSYDLKRYAASIEMVADQAVGSMMELLDSSYGFENIVLVGGGAQMFRKAVRKRFPKHTVHILKEPLYCNVRGFQLMGQEFARESMAAGGAAQAATPAPAAAAAALPAASQCSPGRPHRRLRHRRAAPAATLEAAAGQEVA